MQHKQNQHTISVFAQKQQRHLVQWNKQNRAATKQATGDTGHPLGGP